MTDPVYVIDIPMGVVEKATSYKVYFLIQGEFRHIRQYKPNQFNVYPRPWCHCFNRAASGSKEPFFWSSRADV